MKEEKNVLKCHLAVVYENNIECKMAVVENILERGLDGQLTHSSSFSMPLGIWGTARLMAE